MTLNGINLVIGFCVGLAMGIWLRSVTPDRDENNKAMEWRQPMAARKAAV